jgi:hypothetical protein
MAESSTEWQIEKTGSVCNIYMLENEIACDVTFLCGDRKTEIRAHKYILISRSPVFQAMFCGPLAESRETIEIPDVDADIFRQMLQ